MDDFNDITFYLINKIIKCIQEKRDLSVKLIEPFTILISFLIKDEFNL